MSKEHTPVSTNSAPQLQPFSVRLPSDLVRRAKRKSVDTGVSISHVIRKAITDWVNSTEKLEA